MYEADHVALVISITKRPDGREASCRRRIGRYGQDASRLTGDETYPALELQLGGLLGLGRAQTAIPDDQALARAFILADFVCVLALLPLLRGTHPRELLFGTWSVGKSLLVGFGSSLLLVFCTGLWMKARAGSGTPGPGLALGSDTVRMTQGLYMLYGPWGLLLGTALVTPLIEEFVFRGVFLQVASRHVRFIIAAIVQAAVFAVLHDQPGAYLPLFVLGLAAAVLAWRSNGLLAPAVLHATNNTLAALAIMGITRSMSAMPS